MEYTNWINVFIAKRSNKNITITEAYNLIGKIINNQHDQLYTNSLAVAKTENKSVVHWGPTTNLIILNDNVHDG